MGRPAPQHAVVAVAAFVRQRLADVGGTLAPPWMRCDGGEIAAPDSSSLGTGRELTMAVVGAASQFAPTSYARARLLRQLHASGLLAEPDPEQSGGVEIAQ